MLLDKKLQMLFHSKNTHAIFSNHVVEINRIFSLQINVALQHIGFLSATRTKPYDMLALSYYYHIGKKFKLKTNPCNT